MNKSIFQNINKFIRVSILKTVWVLEQSLVQWKLDWGKILRLLNIKSILNPRRWHVGTKTRRLHAVGGRDEEGRVPVPSSKKREGLKRSVAGDPTCDVSWRFRWFAEPLGHSPGAGACRLRSVGATHEEVGRESGTSACWARRRALGAETLRSRRRGTAVPRWVSASSPEKRPRRRSTPLRLAPSSSACRARPRAPARPVRRRRRQTYLDGHCSPVINARHISVRLLAGGSGRYVSPMRMPLYGQVFMLFEGEVPRIQIGPKSGEAPVRTSPKSRIE